MRHDQLELMYALAIMPNKTPKQERLYNVLKGMHDKEHARPRQPQAPVDPYTLPVLTDTVTFYGNGDSMYRQFDMFRGNFRNDPNFGVTSQHEEQEPCRALVVTYRYTQPDALRRYRLQNPFG